MKSKLKFLGAIIGIVITFSDCKEDTGGLTITVMLNGTSMIQGAFVGIATSQQNLNDSYYLDYQVSDAYGEAVFSNLQPDDYFYQVYYETGSNQYNKEGQIPIISGKRIELTVNLQ